MRHIQLLLGILGALLLTGLYTLVQAESVTPKLGASPASNKKIEPGPSDPPAGSDKKSARPRNRKSKSKRQRAKTEKNQKTAVGSGSGSGATGRTSTGAIDR